MGSTVDKPTASNALYEQDFYAWTQEQVRLLKLGQLSRVDLKNLIEEVEDMGRSEMRSLRSAIKQALLHLTKLAYSPADDPRGDWQVSVMNQRVEIEELLRDNPSLKSKIGEMFREAWPDARKMAIVELGAHGESPQIPEEPPFDLNQLRDEKFIPAKGSSAQAKVKTNWRGPSMPPIDKKR